MDNEENAIKKDNKLKERKEKTEALDKTTKRRASPLPSNKIILVQS